MTEDLELRKGKSLDFQLPEAELGMDSMVDAHEELVQYAIASDKESLKLLGNELMAVQKKLEEKDDAFKSQILHTETITMMAKYQLVYIKMENFWKRLERMIKRRSAGHKCQAFFQMRATICGKAQRKAAFVERAVQALQSLDTTVASALTKRLAAGFSAVNTMAMVSRGSLSALQDEVRLYRSRLADKEKLIKSLRKELGSGSSGQITGLLKKKSSKEKLKLKRKDTIEDLRVIKENQKFMQEKNETLESKIKATESQIFKFINDMSTQISLLQLESSHSLPLSSEALRVKVKKQAKVPSYL